MTNLPLHRGPFALIVAGLALATAGLVTLSLATFQTQSAASTSSLGPGAVTLTFTTQPMNPFAGAVLVCVMAIPLVLLFFPWRFYLSTLVAPVLVALITIGLIVDYQFVAGTVLSSTTWVIVGDAMVFAGCATEAIGIVAERSRRMRHSAGPPTRIRVSRSAAPPPR